MEDGTIALSSTPLRHSKILAILSPMFHASVLDHFRNPRNAGELPGATVVIEVSNPVCGDILRLSARLEHSRILEVRFLCRGCTTAIACASLLTEQLQGRTLSEARALTTEHLSEPLGNLPPATFHAAQLAIDAVQALLKEAR
jgi:NifU-like protein involved in Fe-S cluster formation